MGEPITGQWNRTYTEPYSGASKWGTGVNPIHQFYGEGDPLRVYGRQGERPEVTPPSMASSDFIELGSPWGYQPEDIAGLDVFQLSSEEENRRGIEFHPGDWPDWSETTVQTRANVDPREQPPWGTPGLQTTALLRYGARDDDSEASEQIPTETVSEGWVNKPASGMKHGQSGDEVVTSDPSQYEVQTSMTQRHKTLNNDRALLRGTDDPRESIASRITPMKLKLYSGQQRHYDMFPYQIEDKPRPFWYRTAGTGRQFEMAPNEMYVIEPIQRTPPPDPTLGPPEETLSDPNYTTAFGYTEEDQGWY